VWTFDFRKEAEQLVRGAPDPATYIRFVNRSILGFAWGRTWADNYRVGAFVANVLDVGKSLNYPNGSFFMAGFAAREGRARTNPPPPEANNKAFILPSDPEYRSLIRELS
jgi:hypothetical protein